MASPKGGHVKIALAGFGLPAVRCRHAHGEGRETAALQAVRHSGARALPDVLLLALPAVPERIPQPDVAGEPGGLPVVELASVGRGRRLADPH